MFHTINKAESTICATLGENLTRSETYPRTYISAGWLMSNQSSISRSLGGSFPPTFHVPTHTLKEKKCRTESKYERLLRNNE